MSGRPYARNPRAPFAGPRDLEAILPHTFRVEAPRRIRDAKQEAIRSAIRRRCMQKNWRKMISIRHRRLNEEEAAEAKQNGSVDSEVETKEKNAEKQTEKAPTKQEDAVDAAKRQLEDLEKKLQGLTDQKHAKFQLLKDMLVEEARSKVTGASSTGAAKKRRVEFRDGNSTPSPAKMQSPTMAEVGPASPVGTRLNQASNAS